jgi:hypothetical protein
MSQTSVSSHSDASSASGASAPLHGRRSFLKGAALIVGGFSLAGARIAEAAPAASPTTLPVLPEAVADLPEAVTFSAPAPFFRPVDHLTLDHFAPHQGESFRIHALNSQTGALVPVELKLDQAESLPFAVRQGGDAGLHSFRLLFDGPDDVPLQQGSFQMEHPKYGSMVLFLVPVGQRDGVFKYEAIFNRAS